LTSGGAIDILKHAGFQHTMLDVIEKLLVLQDRDRKILHVRDELIHIPHERLELQGKLASTQGQLDGAKLRGKQIESDRKKLELDVDAKKQQIEKYSLQQLQTKKNEEYRALASEIDGCKQVIFKLEDQQLDLMEQADAAQKQVAAAAAVAADAKKNIDGRLADLAGREANLKKELAELEANRGELAEAVDSGVRSKYERLFKQKGQNVIVGIQHGVCGGCHMQLSRSTIVTCQAEQEIITCTNCGRILYYTRDMDLAVAD
jgi:predicted  nucleic acid-binding Zn-ribbon protein